MTLEDSRSASGQEAVGLRALLPIGTLHFVGIGGAGMCALAEAVLRGGGRVTGCDLAPGGATRALERMGVRIWTEHDVEHGERAVGLIVSAAIPTEHPELVAAREAGTPIWKRARALGEWVEAGDVVAVAGTHGKTTTSAMLTEILATGGLNPTSFVGGRVTAWGGNFRPGGDELFVVEADEYDRSFHELRPTMTLVTSVEADHLDVYGDLRGVEEGFLHFLDRMQRGGTVVLCADDPGAAALASRVPDSVRTYGFSAGSQIHGAEYEPWGSGSRFRVVEDGENRGWINLPLGGVHNATNALGAVAMARLLGVEWSAVHSALADFSGIERRFQVLGEARGVWFVDDYAHHPSEIEAAIEAARRAYPGHRLVAVFQPHLYSRTRDFASGFGAALAEADAVWVTDVYPAREAPIPGVDGNMVAAAVRSVVGSSTDPGRDVHFHRELGTLPERLTAALRPGDVCLTLGAGSIESVGPETFRLLGRTAPEMAHA